jgi:hypothetical protein
LKAIFFIHTANTKTIGLNVNTLSIFPKNIKIFGKTANPVATVGYNPKEIYTKDKQQ